ncbi:MAG: hypothetical protein KDJ16_11735 [Hyphomicrobiales bacterium]|nr:hypothetical protein [Hyphomicrobiales bacterium]
MNGWYVAAAVSSAATCLVHVFLGGREIARPLLAAELRKIPKYTAYYCWHMVTITIAALALAFALAARPGGAIELAYFATGLSALFMAWNLIMIALFRLRLLHFPQWLLFLPGAGFGSIGIMW